MKRRFVTALLSLVMIFSIAAIPAQASSQELVITPRWTNCASISLAMSHSNGTVSWTGAIDGNSDTTKITANYYLYKLGSNGIYSLVASWTGYSTTKTYLDSSGSDSGTAGTYKLTMSGTVQSATYTEPISSSLIKTF